MTGPNADRDPTPPELILAVDALVPADAALTRALIPKAGVTLSSTFPRRPQSLRQGMQQQHQSQDQQSFHQHSRREHPIQRR